MSFTTIQNAEQVSNEESTGVPPAAEAGESAGDEPQAFACRRCGNCCRGEGYVWVTDDDIERISTRLRMTRKEFVSRYARRLPGFGGIVLVDKNDGAQSCIFLEADGCSIHTAKPAQCVGFPVAWSRDDAMTMCAGLQANRRAGIET